MYLIFVNKWFLFTKKITASILVEVVIPYLRTKKIAYNFKEIPTLSSATPNPSSAIAASLGEKEFYFDKSILVSRILFPLIVSLKKNK